MHSFTIPFLRNFERSSSKTKSRSGFNTESDKKNNGGEKKFELSTLQRKSLKEDLGFLQDLKRSSVTLPATELAESITNPVYSSSPLSSEFNLDNNKVNEDEERTFSTYVGFANIPNQIYWKAITKGFDFTLMIVGESGLGKSTLINSMFLTDIYNSDYPGPTRRIKKTTTVEATQVLLKEGGVNLRLTVVDTPGFGDAIDNTGCWVPLIQYIDSKHEEYFTAETSIKRTQMPDRRVHCCIYCIRPTGHSLRAIDIEFMKQLSTKVNIVPIIAKADTLTPEECKEMKIKVLDDIKRHNIRIFEFDDLLKEDDEYELHRTLRDKVPFAVASSNTVVEVDGRNIRGRQYPWGFIEVENLEHCDFKALRKMVICTHLEDLKEFTHNFHYENYRFKKLSPIIGSTCQSVADSPNRDHQKARQLQINGLQISERLEILKTEQKKKNEGMVKLLKNNVKEVQKMKFENNKECWKTVIQSQKLSK